MLTPDISEQIIKLLGQYFIDNAKDFIPIAYSDLTGDEIMLRIIRRKDKPCHQKTRSQDKFPGMKEVSKEDYNEFLKKYPGILTHNTYMGWYQSHDANTHEEVARSYEEYGPGEYWIKE